MGNNPINGIDPDGEFWHIIIGAVVGGITNVAQNWDEATDSPWGWFKTWEKGAFVGAAAAFTGGAAAGAVTGGTAAVGVGAGAAAGVAGGAVGGFVGGAGNAWINGASFDDGLIAGFKAGGYGALTGGVIGGISGGITAVKHGGNLWSGEGAIFASYASGEPIVGEKVEYSTKSAREFSKKYFKYLKYYEDVKLYADGTSGSELYKRSGNWFIEKATQKKAYALHRYLGTGKGSEVYFAPASFTSPRQLYLIMGHEYLHAGYYLGYDNAYNHGNTGKQHAAIYRWEQKVSRRWGNWPTGTGTYEWKHLYNDFYDYKKFFNIRIPWID